MCAKGKLITEITFFSFLALLLSCSPKTDQERKKYSIYTMAKDDSESIVQVDDLSSGEINPKESGTRTYPKQIWYDLIVKDGFYYRLENKNSYFLKYKVENNKYTPVDSVLLSGLSYLDNYNWLDADTLFLISYNRLPSRLSYARVNIKTMKAEVGLLPTQLPTPPLTSMSIGFSERRDNQLLLGYTYHKTTSDQQYTSIDTLYVDFLSYPELKLQKTVKDIRSTYPGSVNTGQPASFRDENGDFYFLACPGIALGNRPEKPTAIYRIKKDEDSLDSSYFFNISASKIQNHGYGLWNIGDGKAIIRSERKELFTGLTDHYKIPHVEFYVLDLGKQTVKKLDLPLDKGTSRQCILVENGLVYISINSDEAGNYIWKYDLKTEKLERGLHITGAIDYILRIEPL